MIDKFKDDESVAFELMDWLKETLPFLGAVEERIAIFAWAQSSISSSTESFRKAMEQMPEYNIFRNGEFFRGE